MKTDQEKIGNAIGESFARVLGTEFLDSKNFLWRMKDGQWVGKPSVQTKDLRRIWVEEAKPEDIDTRHYNLDGTKKLN